MCVCVCVCCVTFLDNIFRPPNLGELSRLPKSELRTFLRVVSLLNRHHVFKVCSSIEYDLGPACSRCFTVYQDGQILGTLLK